MNPAVVSRARFGSNFIRKFAGAIRLPSSNPTVLVATVDPAVRDGLSPLLEAAPVNAIWVSSVEDVKHLLSREKIAACLCGFWLQGGTYREVIRHLRRVRIDVPAIIVSGPSCPQDYREYLAGMNIGALDFLSYPYEQSDFDTILASAIGGDLQASGLPSSVADYQERGAA